MNLFELLKQFKHIEPDADFSAASKRAILARAEMRESLTTPRILFRILEAGTAVALTGFFILVLTGALGTSKLSPVQFSAIDPQAIHAEAQAIDIQIELANVKYEGGSSPESTVSTAVPQTASSSAAVTVPETASSTTTSTPSSDEATASSTTSTVSIDQALQSLAQ